MTSEPNEIRRGVAALPLELGSTIAIRRGDAIVTSNRGHIELVAGAARRKVLIEDV